MPRQLKHTHIVLFLGQTIFCTKHQNLHTIGIKPRYFPTYPTRVGSVFNLYRQPATAWPSNNASSERLGVAVAVGCPSGVGCSYSDRTVQHPILDFPLEDAYVWVVSE